MVIIVKNSLSKSEAKDKIDSFFKTSEFFPEQLKKIKRLAMKFNIKLGAYKKRFCKKCLNSLRGKIRIFANFKTIECERCGFKNRHRIE